MALKGKCPKTRPLPASKALNAVSVFVCSIDLVYFCSSKPLLFVVGGMGPASFSPARNRLFCGLCGQSDRKQHEGASEPGPKLVLEVNRLQSTLSSSPPVTLRPSPGNQKLQPNTTIDPLRAPPTLRDGDGDSIEEQPRVERRAVAEQLRTGSPGPLQTESLLPISVLWDQAYDELFNSLQKVMS